MGPGLPSPLKPPYLGAGANNRPTSDRTIYRVDRQTYGDDEYSDTALREDAPCRNAGPKLFRSEYSPCLRKMTQSSEYGSSSRLAQHVNPRNSPEQHEKIQQVVDEFLISLPLGSGAKSAQLEGLLEQHVYELETEKFHLRDRVLQCMRAAEDMQHLLQRRQSQIQSLQHQVKVSNDRCLDLAAALARQVGTADVATSAQQGAAGSGAQQPLQQAVAAFELQPTGEPASPGAGNAPDSAPGQSLAEWVVHAGQLQQENSALAEQLQECAAAAQDNARLRAQLAEHERRLVAADEVATARAAVHQLEGQVEGLRDELTRSRAAAVDAQRQAEEAIADQARLRGALMDAELELQRLSANDTSGDAAPEELRLQQLQRDNARLTELAAAAQSVQDTISAQLCDAQCKVSELERQVVALQQEQGASRAEAHAARQQAVQARQDAARAAQEAHAAVQAASTATQDAASARQAADAATADATAHADEAALARQSSVDARHQMRSAAQEASAAQAARRTADDQARKLKEELELERAALQQLQLAHAELHGDAQRRRDELLAIAAEKHALSETLSAIGERMQKLHHLCEQDVAQADARSRGVEAERAGVEAELACAMRRKAAALARVAHQRAQSERAGLRTRIEDEMQALERQLAQSVREIEDLHAKRAQVERVGVEVQAERHLLHTHVSNVQISSLERQKHLAASQLLAKQSQDALVLIFGEICRTGEALCEAMSLAVPDHCGLDAASAMRWMSALAARLIDQSGSDRQAVAEAQERLRCLSAELVLRDAALQGAHRSLRMAQEQLEGLDRLCQEHSDSAEELQQARVEAEAQLVAAYEALQYARAVSAERAAVCTEAEGNALRVQALEQQLAEGHEAKAALEAALSAASAKLRAQSDAFLQQLDRMKEHLECLEGQVQGFATVASQQSKELQELAQLQEALPLVQAEMRQLEIDNNALREELAACRAQAAQAAARQQSRLREALAERSTAELQCAAAEAARSAAESELGAAREDAVSLQERLDALGEVKATLERESQGQSTEAQSLILSLTGDVKSLTAERKALLLRLQEQGTLQSGNQSNAEENSIQIQSQDAELHQQVGQPSDKLEQGQRQISSCGVQVELGDAVLHRQHPADDLQTALSQAADLQRQLAAKEDLLAVTFTRVASLQGQVDELQRTVELSAALEAQSLRRAIPTTARDEAQLRMENARLSHEVARCSEALARAQQQAASCQEPEDCAALTLLQHRINSREHQLATLQAECNSLRSHLYASQQTVSRLQDEQGMALGRSNDVVKGPSSSLRRLQALLYTRDREIHKNKSRIQQLEAQLQAVWRDGRDAVSSFAMSSPNARDIGSGAASLPGSAGVRVTVPFSPAASSRPSPSTPHQHGWTYMSPAKLRRSPHA